MKTLPDGILKIAGAAGARLIRGWMSTLDYKAAYYDPGIDPAYPGDGRIRLYVFWHEYMQFFIHLRRHCSLAMLLSRHRDADVLEKLAHATGFETVRGSSRRGGAEALLGMMKKENAHLHLTITPDGPRGPRRKMAPGAVYLASKLGIPIVAIGVGYDRPWRTPTWDRFALPRPGTRARAIPSGDLIVPPNLSKAGIGHYTSRIERLLERLTETAEDWAEKGYSIAGESDILPGPKHSILYFSRAKQADIEPSHGNS